MYKPFTFVGAVQLQSLSSVNTYVYTYLRDIKNYVYIYIC